MKKGLLLIIISFSVIFGAWAQEHVAHQDTIRMIKFSPDNSFIVTSADDDMVRLWDTKKGNMLRAFHHGYDIKKIFIHPKGTLMITSDAKYSTCLWDLEEGKAVKCLSGLDVEGFTPDGNNIILVEYGNDGKRYASLSFLSLPNYEKKVFPHKIYTEGAIGKFYFFKGDPSFLIAQEKSVFEFNPEKGLMKEKYSLKEKPEYLAISSDQKWYTTPGEKSIYDLKKNKKAFDLEEPMKKGNESYFWFMDGNKQLVSVFNREITIFETDSGRVVKKLFPTGYKYQVSEDLQLIASSETGKNLVLKSLETGDTLFSYVAEDLIKRTGYQNYLKGIKSFHEQDYRRAIDFFTKSIGTINEDKAYLLRGRSYAYLEKYDKAIEDFLIDEQLYKGRASLDLAKAYAAKGNARKSVEYLERHFSSQYKTRWTTIVEDKQFDPISSDTIWQQFVQKQVVTDAENSALSSEGKIKRKEFKEAVTLLDASIKQEPNNPDWYHLRGKVKTEMGAYGDAVSDFRKELSLDPKRKMEVYHNIAVVFAKKGELKKSSALLYEIVRNDSSQFNLLLDIAEIELERYDRKNALDAIDTYLSVLPDDDEAYYIKAHILDAEDAKRNIEKAIELCKTQNKKVPQKYYDFQKSFL